MRLLIFFNIIFCLIASSKKSFGQEIKKSSGYFLLYTVSEGFYSDYQIIDTVLIEIPDNQDSIHRKYLVNLFLNDPTEFLGKISSWPKIYIDYQSWGNYYFNNKNFHKPSTTFLKKVRDEKTYEFIVSKRLRCYNEELNSKVSYSFTLGLFHLNDTVLLSRHYVQKNLVGCGKLLLNPCNEVIINHSEYNNVSKEDVVYFPILSPKK